VDVKHMVWMKLTWCEWFRSYSSSTNPKYATHFQFNGCFCWTASNRPSSLWKYV